MRAARELAGGDSGRIIVQRDGSVLVASDAIYGHLKADAARAASSSQGPGGHPGTALPPA
jgi:hypothetical protein